MAHIINTVGNGLSPFDSFLFRGAVRKLLNGTANHGSFLLERSAYIVMLINTLFESDGAGFKKRMFEIIEKIFCVLDAYAETDQILR